MKKGYLLYNSKGEALTRDKQWGTKPESGWLWNVRTANRIISQAYREDWEVKPEWIQPCILVIERDGDMNVYSTGEMEQI